MLPTGHIAGGALLGAYRSRRSTRHPAAEIGAGVLAGCLPDLDLLIPTVLDRVGVKHRLNSGTHHSWMTHTPLFWGAVAVSARRLSRHRRAPGWSAEAADLLGAGVSLHLVQDTVANTVALLWPLRRREYGMGLDHLGGVDDHVEYMRRYPFSPAGKLELALVVGAVVACTRQLRAWPGARAGD